MLRLLLAMIWLLCIGYFYGPAPCLREFGFWMAFGEQCKNVLHDVTHVTDGHTMGHKFDRIQTNHDRPERRCMLPSNKKYDIIFSAPRDHIILANYNAV